jgi:hypothetical protein
MEGTELVPTQHRRVRARRRRAAGPLVVAAATALVLVGAGAGAALATGGAGVFHDDSGQTVVFYAGAVRPTASGWALVEDSAHTPLNLASVSCSSAGTLVVMLSAPGSKVLGATVETDETLSRADVVAGASVGLDRVVIKLSRAGKAVSCSSSVLRSPYANLWISGTMLA